MPSPYLSVVAINGKHKQSQTPLNVARHNLRTIEAELRGRKQDRINPALSVQNQILRGPDTPEAVITLMERLWGYEGAKVIRKDQICMFEVVVDPLCHENPSLTDLDTFFEDAILWLVSWFDCPLLSAIVHHDEARPHMHLLFTPLKDGRLQGAQVMGNRTALSKMQAEFAAQLAARHGCQKTPKYTQNVRSMVAETVIRYLLGGRAHSCVTVNQEHQLRKAILAAPDMHNLAAAFDVLLDSTSIEVDEQRRVRPPTSTMV